jgi:alpha-mannosidase
VEFDSGHGGIRRIYDKELGVELLDTSEKFGNVLFSSEKPAVSSTDHRASLELVETGPNRATMRIRSRIAEVPYECSVSLLKNLKRIDFDLRIDYGRGVDFGFDWNRVDRKEYEHTGLFVRFPLQSAGRLYTHQPFGIYPADKHQQVTLDLADVYNDAYGVALIHHNTPVCFYKQGVLSLLLAQGKPFVVGEQRYQYSLYSHAGRPDDAGVFQQVRSITTPYIVYQGDNAGAREVGTRSFLRIDQDNVFLSSMYTAEGALYLRLFEMGGKATRTQVRLPFIGSTACYKVRLNGEREKSLSCDKGTVELDIRPWEIVTLAFPQ